MYQKVTPAVIARLQAIVGEKNVIFADPEKMADYSHDEIAEKEFAQMPEVVAKPTSAQEVAAIMKLAGETKIPVTPRGAGTGLSGGAVPVYGGILLSVENMNRILEIDLENLIMVVEPGVITNDLNNAAMEHGLFFAGYPMSLQSCFIGGNVAENAGGGRAIKYGVTSRYITGLETVLPSGEIVEFGGKRVKDVTGYNILQLMIGSEGTLGIFTKIYVKLLPLPKAKIDLMVTFPDIASAIAVVPLIMTKMRIVPTGIEFMDKVALDTSCQYIGEKKKFEECGAILLIEMDGNEHETVRNDCLSISDLCLENNALDAYLAEGPADQEKMWKVRRSVAEAFKAISPEQSLEDIVVPISKITALMPHLAALSEKHDVLIPCYGHAGDGNLHATIVKKKEDTIERWQAVLPQVLAELYGIVHSLGGTISGEHGIGHKRKKYLPIVLGNAEIELMKRIKIAFDPDNILNPGKIFV